jgi:AcrR family transcriptional regulator
MTALATELGVKGPSLYNHVRGLDDVLGAVQVRTFARLGSQMQRGAMGKVGPDAIRALSDVLRTFATQNPNRYELTMRAPFDADAVAEGAAAAHEALAAVIRSFGVEEDVLELEVTCFATLHGVLALDRSGLLEQTVSPSNIYERSVKLLILMLEQQGTSNPPVP